MPFTAISGLLPNDKNRALYSEELALFLFWYGHGRLRNEKSATFDSNLKKFMQNT